MVQRFKNFIKKNELFLKEDRVLLAVSGGKDSTLMVHLFQEAGFLFGIAHCNFKLRGEAADQDQLFVKELAAQLNAPFYTTRFNTKEIAQQRGISIQMAARDLRYEWLSDIQTQNNYQFLATAHHLNDSMETIIYNLSKGCGIRGLQGIPVKNGSIIRPLLFASAKGIETEVSKRKLQYRSDASNKETKYARNKIRHHVIPQLEALNPAITDTFLGNIRRFRDTLSLFEQAVNQFRRKYVTEENGLLYIDKVALDQESAKHTLLFEMLKDKGFSSSQLEDALAGTTKTGAVFYSKDHRLLVDRAHYVLAPTPEVFEPVLVSKEALPITISINEYDLIFSNIVESSATIQKKKNTAIIDASQLQFPLSIRTWRRGDYFCPLGMDGQRKKLQDYFSDNKLSIFEKERQLLLQNGNGDIIWVIGKRLDERYKIRPTTKSFLKTSTKN